MDKAMWIVYATGVSLSGVLGVPGRKGFVNKIRTSSFGRKIAL
jgi:hypothetical protein